MPLKIAMWMLLSGERMSAERSVRVGLVNRVVPLRTDGRSNADGEIIARNRPAAVRMAKKIALRSLDRPLVDPPEAWDLYDLIPDT